MALSFDCISSTKKDIFLANSLYDCLEDLDLRNLAIILQNKAADPNIILPEQGISPFHFIIGNESASFAEEVTKLFLQYGGDPNVKSIEGMTPVHVAAAWGRSSLLHLLLVNGGNPWVHDVHEKNAFHYAFEEKHWDVVQLLHRFRLMDLASNEDHGHLKYKIALERVIVNSGDVRVEYGIKPQSVDYLLNTDSQSESRGVEPFFKHSTAEGNNTDVSTIYGRSNCASPLNVKSEQESSKGRTKNVLSNLIDDFENKLVVINHSCDSLKDSNIDRTFPVENKKYDVHKSVDMFSSEELHVSNNLLELKPLTNSSCERATNETKDWYEVKAKTMNNCRRCLFPTHQKYDFNISNEVSRQTSRCTSTTNNSFVMIGNSHFNTTCEVNNPQLVDVGRQQLLHDIPKKCDLNIQSECEYESRLTEWLASQSHYLRTVTSESSLTYCTCDEASESEELVEVQPLKKEPPDLDLSVQSLISGSSSSYKTYISEEYKYTDEEEGVVLLERRLLVNNAGISGILETDDSHISSLTSTKNTDEYDTETLRGELKAIGYTPGPITATTKRIYRRQLIHNGRRPCQTTNSNIRVYSSELQCMLKNVEWQSDLSYLMSLEQEVANQFANPDPKRRWREGIIKSSFSYLLLDPRITDNLPSRANELSSLKTWSTFLSSVFYIGKGKRSRPYSHLYQAVAVWKKDTGVRTDKKVNYILDIWKTGLGVVCLHVFQNVIPVEAYTREAAMIDAMGLQNLTNNRHSEYYGKAATWTSRVRKKLGIYLLYRSMLIFLSEGERHLRPGDIG